MNAAKRAEVIQAFLKEHSDGVMKDKGGAYSRGEENCNSNFYRVGEALGHEPMQVAWVYALKHIDALSAYIKGGCKGKLIGSESVEGRIGDAVNYLLILYSILVQEGVLDEPTLVPEVEREPIPVREDTKFYEGKLYLSAHGAILRCTTTGTRTSADFCVVSYPSGLFRPGERLTYPVPISG